jgi:hypothetical protein
MPIAGCFGYWDKYLSSGMYSGKGRLKQFYFEDKNGIPPDSENMHTTANKTFSQDSTY